MDFIQAYFDHLLSQFARRRPLLFTGAGFSYDLRDKQGNTLPLGWQLTKEIWDLVFPGQDMPDNTKLRDVYQVALQQRARDLGELLERRLSVGTVNIPDYYENYFGVPWARVYTLNVDDLEEALWASKAMPFDIESKSGTTDRATKRRSRPRRPLLEVVHLNGAMIDVPHDVTFGHRQYVERSRTADPRYADLATELLNSAVVYVGSELDEESFWRHVEDRGSRGPRGHGEQRPRSYLVLPSLNPARQALLSNYNVRFLQGTAREFAETYLQPMLGRLGADAFNVAPGSTRTGVRSVADCMKESRPGGAEYLMGAQPHWQDFFSGRVASRAVQEVSLRKARDLLKEARAENGLRVLAITGTAGAGKSTAMHAVGMALNADGREVGWVGYEDEVSPREIADRFVHEDGMDALLIDDAGRYGSGLGRLISNASMRGRAALLVIGLRSGQARRLLDKPALESVGIQQVHIPDLANEDVLELLGVLEANHRLGVLRSLSRTEQVEILRGKCGRQLLVAMIEATSGKRFEAKVHSEYDDREPLERRVYAALAVATNKGHYLAKDELLLAIPEEQNLVLNALQSLVSSRIITERLGRQFRARHGRIAEVLVSEFRTRGTLVHPLRAVVRAAAARWVSGGSDRLRRLLKSLLNHRYLLRVLDDLDAARGIYAEVETVLDRDHHYWLQRGSLELEEGNLGLADNFLGQASALNETDHLVQTAIAHLQFRQAAAKPGVDESVKKAATAEATLRDLILARGSADDYPYHILGSQGLHWSRRAGLPRDERTRYLKSLLDCVELGLEYHRGNPGLMQLQLDLKREWLQVGSGLK